MLWMILAVPVCFLGVCTIAAMVHGSRCEERAQEARLQASESAPQDKARNCA